MSHAGMPGQHRQGPACGAHAQSQRPFELLAVEFAHAEGDAAQFLHERKLGSMLQPGFLQEHPVHFDRATPSKQGQDKVQQIPAGTA
jgi:hypothetical protein